MNSLIKKYSKARKLQYKACFTQYYSERIGTVKGLKKIEKVNPVYLIEFSDYSRVWATSQELDLF